MPGRPRAFDVHLGRDCFGGDTVITLPGGGHPPKRPTVRVGSKNHELRVIGAAVDVLKTIPSQPRREVLPIA